MIEAGGTVTRGFLVAMSMATLMSPALADSTEPEWVETVRRELAPLDFTVDTPPSKAVGEYLSFYSLRTVGAKHRIGTFESGTNTIAANIFTPPSSRGTVIIVHGYYDHAGVWKHVIRELIRQKYTVAVYDQPGHGLSTGKRADIGSFDEYVETLKKFVALCQDNLPGPYHVAAHSMGGGIVMEYLLRGRPKGIGQVVLVAPMIRSKWWKSSGVGIKISSSVTESLPRAFRKNSSDKAFLEFHKNDPLQPRVVPSGWVKAQRSWVSKLEKVDPRSAKPLLVIQGTKDSTLEWEYNMKLIKRMFPNAKVELVDKGGHQLINEGKEMRSEVIRMMVDWLGAR